MGDHVRVRSGIHRPGGHGVMRGIGRGRWALTRAVALSIAALAIGCADANDPPTAPSPLPSTFSSHSSAYFTFRHSPLDERSIADTAAAVERHVDRITSDLGLRAMPRVTVWLYPDRSALQEAVRPIVGTLPAFASGLVTGVDQIHILSPSLASAWPYDRGITNIVHEFTHCVTLALNSAIANSPRWLWEAVAIYEAGQLVDPRTVPSMITRQPLALATLNGFDNTLIYDVGYTIAEFIVDRGGPPALRQLVAANGDTIRVLGLTSESFVTEWFAFVERRYGV